MFSWYRNADVCYVFLGDVDSCDWRTSRWWRRGWTLQELIAPRKVVFFDRQWRCIGTKVSMSDGIQKITQIPVAVLKNQQSHMCWTIAQRMAWAADRHTQRIEDRAYSLLGLFQLSMSLLYGEGDRAFERLQLELLQRYPDESVFAWSSSNRKPHHVLASSPDDFKNCSAMEPRHTSHSVAIDPDLRRVNPARMCSWGIELSVSAWTLHPFQDVVINGKTQKFLLAFTLTVASAGSIQELPCTLVLIRTGPAPYNYQRQQCLWLESDRALQHLAKTYRVGDRAKEFVVYLLFDKHI